MSNKLPPAKAPVIFKKISFKPLTSETWKDFEDLFGEKGATGGCWCMYWRVRRSEYVVSKGLQNKKKMKKMVSTSELPPGIILYADRRAVGWCAVGPRESFPVLANSRILRPVDDQPVWSIVCFFIDKDFRRMGLTEIFLKYAIEFCKKHGAAVVEGYPFDVSGKNYPAVFAFTGIASAYLKAGFKEVARRSEGRPVMRYMIED